MECMKGCMKKSQKQHIMWWTLVEGLYRYRYAAMGKLGGRPSHSGIWAETKGTSKASRTLGRTSYGTK
eukprot:scaffold226291_cov47-Attheya_sp.AAC.1